MCESTDPFADDILQPLPIERFADYRNACAQQLPHAIRGHHFLLLQERWIRYLRDPVNKDVDISARCKYHFFIHRGGNVQNCTFIAITEEATNTDVSIKFANSDRYIRF